MIVDISETGKVSLAQWEDLKAFHVSARQGPAAIAESLLRVGARFDGTHAWIAPDWIRSAGAPNDQAWLADFQAMLDYASSKGWVAPDSGLIRAHVEWQADA